jgi:hypothetical protein
MFMSVLRSRAFGVAVVVASPLIGPMILMARRAARAGDPILACSWIVAAVVGWCGLDIAAAKAIAWDAQVIVAHGRPIVAGLSGSGSAPVTVDKRSANSAPSQ